MKKRLHVFITLLILLTFCVSPSQAFALPACHYEHDTFCGEDIYEPGSLEASYVDYVQESGRTIQGSPKEAPCAASGAIW